MLDCAVICVARKARYCLANVLSQRTASASVGADMVIPRTSAEPVGTALTELIICCGVMVNPRALIVLSATVRVVATRLIYVAIAPDGSAFSWWTSRSVVVAMRGVGFSTR